MSRAVTSSQVPRAAGSAGSRADAGRRAAAGVTVAMLAGIAGAISYSHMRELAAAHGEAGWHAHTFPLSVDGIEIVASLVLLADRRSGRRPGWLPWAALAAGTTASLAANVAAAGTDLTGRVIAGWPAIALLIAVKLLSGLLERRRDAERPAADDHPASRIPSRSCPPCVRRDEPRPARPAASCGTAAREGRPIMSPLPGTGMVPHPGDGNGRAGRGGRSGPAVPRTQQRHRAGTSRASGTGTGTAAHAGTGTVADAVGLLPASRAALDRLLERGDPITRDSLAAQLRHDGHPVRNARVSSLLTALRSETQ